MKKIDGSPRQWLRGDDIMEVVRYLGAIGPGMDIIKQDSDDFYYSATKLPKYIEQGYDHLILGRGFHYYGSSIYSDMILPSLESGNLDEFEYYLILENKIGDFDSIDDLRWMSSKVMKYPGVSKKYIKDAMFIVVSIYQVDAKNLPER